MKKLLHLSFALVFLPLLGHAQFACSGLDRVDIYLNQKLVGTATQANAPTVKLNSSAKADTLLFHAYTNWEGLRNSTMDVKDETGELIDHVNGNSSTGYEAVYAYVYDHNAIDDPDLKTIDIFINLLCERDVVPEQICTLNLAAK